MKANKEQKKQERHFWCKRCQYYWLTDQYEEQKKPTNDKYPYESECPKCGELTANNHHCVAQILGAKPKCTGPRTEEGKARSSQNAFKTGMFSTRSSYLAPALYGKYPECRQKTDEVTDQGDPVYEDTCEHAKLCKQKLLRHCPHQLNLIVQYAAAYEDGDANALKQFAGIAQGRIHVLLEKMYQEVIQEGLQISEPSRFGILKKAHPMLDQIGKFMPIAGFTSDQQQMNPKSQPDGAEHPEGTMEFKGDPNDFIGLLAYKMDQARAKMKVVSEDKQEEDHEAEIVEKAVEVGPEDNPFEKRGAKSVEREEKSEK